VPRDWPVRQAVRALRRGGLVAYPTEAVYGLGCNPLDPYAVGRLLALKHRPVAKGLILIAERFEQLAPWLAGVPPRLAERALATWPGPVTWTWPAQDWVPDWLRGEHSTLAVRVTAHPVAAALCRRWGGALVSTSANPAGLRPARNPLHVQCYFGNQVDTIIHGATGPRSSPTPIHDLLSENIIRPA